MASTDARPVPLKNTAMRITFPLRDSSGNLVTGAAALDSEVSKDGGTFTDCTNEATEIATASGIYYLDITATEMNADTVAIIVKATSVITFSIVMYPDSGGDITVNVGYWNGTAVATPATAGIPDVNVKNIDNDAASASGTVTFPNATLASTTNITAGTITTVSGNVTGNVGGNVTGSVGSVTGNVGGNVVGSVASVSGNVGGNVVGSVASVSGNVGGNVTGSVGSVATGGITASSFAANAIDASAVAASAVAEIQSGLATSTATTDIQSRLPAALVSGRMDASVGAMADDVITSSALAASAVTEIVTGVTTTTLTESYSTVGSSVTLAQGVYLMMQRLYNFQISGTTINITKLDGSTSAAQITIDSSTAPTTSERTS